MTAFIGRRELITLLGGAAAWFRGLGIRVRGPRFRSRTRVLAPL
jgi:hypothetical protein